MKKIFGLISCLLITGVILIGCGGDQETSRTGEEIFNAECSGCHGADLKGMGQDLTNLKDKSTKEQILEITKNGSGSMPGGLVTDAENELAADWLLQQ